MSIFERSNSAWTGRMLSVLRMVVGLLFMEHGMQKLFGWPVPMPMPIALTSQMGLAGVLETFGGAAIVLGLLTRPVAFLLAGEMAVAYFQAHFPRSFYPIKSMGELPVFFCFTYLYFMLAGGGPWSLDALIAASRRGAGPGTTR